MVRLVATVMVVLGITVGSIVAAPAATIVVPAVDTPWPGKIFVGHDEWALSDWAFSQTPNDSAALARNVAAWFTRGRNGRFLVYSTNFGLRGTALATTMRNAGHTWTIGMDAPFTLEALQPYDAVFLAGDRVDPSVLIDYVRAGGHVFLLGGTGIGGTAEAAHWNVFLNAFGLNMDVTYDPARPPGLYLTQSTSPLFNGVTALYDQLGYGVTRLNAADPATAILAWSNQAAGRGSYATYETRVLTVPVKVCPSKIKVTATGDLTLWLVGSPDLNVTRVDLASLDLFGARVAESKLENKTAPPTGPLVGQTSVPACGGKDQTMDVVLKFDRRTVVQGIERVLGRTLAKGELVALTLIGRLTPEHGGVPIVGETIMEVDR